MTDSQNATQPAEAEVQARLKDLEEENELLLLQLHQVQEELENYFLKCQELEKGGRGAYSGSTSVGGWVDDEMPSLQAEVLRLTALAETQSRLREIESKNALNARLGDILIQSVSPSGSIVGLPGKLLGIWRASKAEQPSAALGGKNFDKVIEAFQKDGLESVNQLLAAEPAPEMRAKAYTALARHQMKNGQFADAALSARRAYEEDPKPYRLKWLAFRLHDAGEIAEADSCISLLPQDTPFSDSEARQRDQVCYEAKNARLRDAKQKTDFESRRQAMESQVQSLRRDCDKHARLAVEREAEIGALRQTMESQMQSLRQDCDKIAKLAAERENEITSLRQVADKFEQERVELKKSVSDSKKQIAQSERGKFNFDDFVKDLEMFFHGKKIVYVDIGAYLGEIYLKIKNNAKCFSIHEAHLFEPNPDSYVQLTEKIQNLNLEHSARVYNLAIGVDENSVPFISAKTMTKKISIDEKVVNNYGGVFCANSVSLDSQKQMFTDGKINLLKIDVEGEEITVLSSCRKLLECQSVDIIYIECGFNIIGTQQTYFADIDKYLQEFGYRVFRIYEQKEEWMSGSPLLRRANFAYMSEKFANAHPIKLIQELHKLKSELDKLKLKI